MKSFSRAIICLLLFGLPAFAGSRIQGIRNFRQVDAHVYRGGQPTSDGLKYLAQIGVKTIVDLRETGTGSAAEAQAVKALGMNFVGVPMSGLTPPSPEQVAKILALLEDASGGPVFVHCRRGADRTGAVIAAYRIDHDRWDNARALEEAMSDGMSFFQLPRQNFIRRFQPLTIAASSAKPDASPAGTVAAATTPAAAVPAAAVAVPAVQ